MFRLPPPLRRRLPLPLLLMVGVTLIGRAQAQTPPPDRDNPKLQPPNVQVEPAPDLAQPLPFDPDVRTGTLPNGMTYYIRRNGWPENRIALRLAVNAGSVLERDDQQGLAHFLEHMNFNGSEHFASGDLVKYLESIGARFGADANAYTSFDETVYRLDLPADQDSLMIKGLWAMGDYAGRALLSDTEIEKERGVVLDEWRRGLGAQMRMLNKHYPILLEGSAYATRLPIGKPEIIEHAPPQRIRDFYKEWYRPERMAIVIVGALDPDKMTALLTEEFSDIPKSATLTPLPAHDVPIHPDLKVSIATDAEARFTTASLDFKRPHTDTKTLGDYRDNLTDDLVYTMLDERLDEIARHADAHFISGFTNGGSFVRPLDVFSVNVRTEDGKVEPGIETAVTELKRAAEHGFGQAELDRARDTRLALTERAHDEKLRTENTSFAGEYVRNFLDHEPSPGIENEYAWTKQLLPGITLADANGALTRMIASDSRVLTVSAPQKDGVAAPDEASLRTAIDRAWKSEVGPWVDTVANRALVEKAPAAGKVVATRTISEIGVTVLTMSNGAEVWMKPTDFKTDQILIGAWSLGGASVVDPADYQEAVRSSIVVGEAGIGGLAPVELEKLLAGKLVSGLPNIGSWTHGLSGSSTPRDLETAMQLLYLTFTQPTDRPEAYDVLRKRWRSDMQNRMNDPDALFSDAVGKINSNDHYMNRPMTLADVEAFDFPKSVAIYQSRFANAADFTFLFVGSFDPKVLTPLAEQWIGSLPSTGKRTAAVVDRAMTFPTSIQKAEIDKGIEPKSRTTVTFFAPTGRDEMEMYRARMISNIFRRRLRETLREELGATYSVGANFGGPSPGVDWGTVTVSYGSAPENADRMVDTTLAIAATLRDHGPRADEVASIQEQERRELEVAEKNNGYWLGSLMSVQQFGFDPARIAKRRERIETLTVDSLHDAARKYLSPSRWTRVTLNPAEGVTSAQDKPAKP